MIQNVIVIAIITAAIIYAAVVLMRKRRAFSVKPGCSDGCDCNK